MEDKESSRNSTLSETTKDHHPRKRLKYAISSPKKSKTNRENHQRLEMFLKEERVVEKVRKMTRIAQSSEIHYHIVTK